VSPTCASSTPTKHDVADTVATVKAVYNITIKKDYRIDGMDKKSPSFP